MRAPSPVDGDLGLAGAVSAPASQLADLLLGLIPGAAFALGNRRLVFDARRQV
jgi:hypothetical protein